MSFAVDLDTVERTGVQIEPQSKGAHINALAKCVKRLNPDPITLRPDVTSESLPAKLAMLDNVRRRIRRNTEKVRTVITRVRIPSHVLWKRMKCRSGEAVLIDIAQATHGSSVSRAKQMKVLRVVSKCRQHRDGIETRSIMMQLPLTRSSRRCTVKEIPEAPSTAIVSPVWNRRHVTENGVERDLRFRIVAEILCDSVNLFLPRGVPRHLTSIWQRTPVPVFGAGLHLSLQRCGLRLPAFTLEIVEQ